MSEVRNVHSEAEKLGLLPNSAEPERRQLYDAALSELELEISQYQLIRDLLCLSGIEKDAPLEAGLMALLVAREEGSLCLRLDEDSITRRLPEFGEAKNLAAQFVERVRQGQYAGKLMGSDPTDFLPLFLKNDLLYFQQGHHDEALLESSYEQRLGEEPALTASEFDRLRHILDEVLSAPQQTSGGETLQFNSQQKWALAMAMLEKFLVITGGPGTGKTSIVLAVLRCLVRRGIAPERIALAAPTGRAAQRMTESLHLGLERIPARSDIDTALRKLEGQTLHRLLGYFPPANTFTYDRVNPLSLDVLVVDEVSMVDATLMARLLDALPAGTQLILLGDVNQLPSVDAGAVLADLVPPHTEPVFSSAVVSSLSDLLKDTELPPASQRDRLPRMANRVVRLEKDYRSKQEIQDLAKAINEYSPGHEGELLQLANAGSCRLDDSSLGGDVYQAVLKNWTTEHYLDSDYVRAVSECEVPAQMFADTDEQLKRVLGHLPKARILTAIHHGPRGERYINNVVADLLRPRMGAGDGAYFPGLPIMVTRNDYAHDLFNGDTGLVLRDAEGALRVAFPRGDRVLLLPIGSLPEHDMAFAITVHKSQGSEFDEVLLVLPAEAGSAHAQQLLSRQILYTAVTRAREKVTINAQREVFLRACENVLQRDSGLKSLWESR